MDTKTRIYIFNGFLDSGKTSFLKDTVLNTDFCENEKSLIIVSEQGEVEYNEEELKPFNCDIVYIEDENELNSELFNNIENKYHPTQIFIELNGMYNTDNVIDIEMPSGYQVVQILTTINAKTFNLYVNNMRSLIYTQVVKSDLVVFNRIDDTIKKSTLRNTIKAINGAVQIIYENEDGTIDNVVNDELPYDTSSDYIEVLDHDFGIFCYDTLEHPETYDEKTIKIRGKYYGQDKLLNNGFILGREAMVCCEQDTSLIGMVCVHPSSNQLVPGEWVELEGKLYMTYDQEYNSNIDVLYVSDLKVIQPLSNPYVTFD